MAERGLRDFLDLHLVSLRFGTWGGKLGEPSDSGLRPFVWPHGGSWAGILLTNLEAAAAPLGLPGVFVCLDRGSGVRGRRGMGVRTLGSWGKPWKTWSRQGGGI